MCEYVLVQTTKAENPAMLSASIVAVEISLYDKQDRIMLNNLLKDFVVIKLFKIIQNQALLDLDLCLTSEDWLPIFHMAMSSHNNNLDVIYLNKDRNDFLEELLVLQNIETNKLLLAGHRVVDFLSHRIITSDRILFENSKKLYARIQDDVRKLAKIRDLDNKKWILDYGTSTLKEMLRRSIKSRWLIDPRTEIFNGGDYLTDEECLFEEEIYKIYLSERIKKEYPGCVFVQFFQGNYSNLPSVNSNIINDLSKKIEGEILLFSDFLSFDLDEESVFVETGIKISKPFIAVHKQHILGHVFYLFDVSLA